MDELLRDGPAEARTRLLLAHGAGAGMRHAFMQQVAQGLGERGLCVLRFEFPYMAKLAEGRSRGAPDPQPVLLDAYRKVIAANGGARLLIGGKSMGGRIASMIADEVNAIGLVCLGYPFHPPKQPTKLRTAHLANLRTPTLIVQGTRDEFGTRDEVAGYTLSKQIEVSWVEDGDHSLSPRRKNGHDPKLALERVLDQVATFAERC